MRSASVFFVFCFGGEGKVCLDLVNTTSFSSPQRHLQYFNRVVFTMPKDVHKHVQVHSIIRKSQFGCFNNLSKLTERRKNVLTNDTKLGTETYIPPPSK